MTIKQANLAGLAYAAGFEPEENTKEAGIFSSLAGKVMKPFGQALARGAEGVGTKVLSDLGHAAAQGAADQAWHSFANTVTRRIQDTDHALGTALKNRIRTSEPEFRALVRRSRPPLDRGVYTPERQAQGIQTALSTWQKEMAPKFQKPQVGPSAENLGWAARNGRPGEFIPVNNNSQIQAAALRTLSDPSPAGQTLLGRLRLAEATSGRDRRDLLRMYDGVWDAQAPFVPRPEANNILRDALRSVRTDSPERGPLKDSLYNSFQHTYPMPDLFFR